MYIFVIPLSSLSLCAFEKKWKTLCKTVIKKKKKILTAVLALKVLLQMITTSSVGLIIFLW